MINGTHAIDLIVSRDDRIGRRTVRALDGDREVFRDCFAIDEAQRRHDFVATVRERLPELPEAEFAEMGKRLLAMQDELDGQDGSAPVEFRRITAAELASTHFDIRFFVPGLLVADQPQGIFGPKKALKTSLMLDLAISVASGRPFLGYFHGERTARVGVFSGESGMATIQETCLRISRAAGVDLADLPIVFSDTLPQFGNVSHIDALEKFLVADGIELLFIDPAYLAMLTAGNEGSLFAMGALLRGVSEMCQRIGVTVVLLHHMKKSVADPYAPGDLDDASWAGFAEFCRGWMLINRREKYEPGSGQHKLWLSVGGSVGHSGLWGLDVFEGVYSGPGSRTWQVDVLKAEEVREGVQEAQEQSKQQKQSGKLDAAKRSLAFALAKFPAGETERVIRDTAGISGTIAKLALSALIQEGVAIPVGVVKPNRKAPYEGYKLAESTT